jgi:hypothetical protein
VTKFCAKLGKNGNEILECCKNVNATKAMSQAIVFWWLKLFIEENKIVVDSA